MQEVWQGKEFINNGAQVVVIHPGLLEGANDGFCASLRENLYTAGVVSITVEPTGYDDMGSEKYRPSKWREDLDDLIDGLIKEGVGENRLYLVGHSLGGTIVADCATRKNVGGVVIISSPFEIDPTLDPDLAEWEKKGEKEFPMRRSGKVTIPYKLIEDAQMFDMARICPQVRGKKLVIAGTEDQTISYQSTQQVFDRLADPKQWELIQGMGHIYKKQPETMNRVNEIVVDFVTTRELVYAGN